MREVAVHESHSKTWGSPPSRPWVKDGAVVRGDDGKIQYSPLFEFESAAVRTAFSDAVIRSVREFEPQALASGVAS